MVSGRVMGKPETLQGQVRGKVGTRHARHLDKSLSCFQQWTIYGFGSLWNARALCKIATAAQARTKHRPRLCRHDRSKQHDSSLVTSRWFVSRSSVLSESKFYCSIGLPKANVAGTAMPGRGQQSVIAEAKVRAVNRVGSGLASSRCMTVFDWEVLVVRHIESQAVASRVT